ncbi:hypothetical protein DNU06_01135 [Putridiphycobacter roseus]|uniref:Uncharacterized protein n=1 Tax=Putridiphycobacter roseus TaxID=2219161 RepID=A0A2W1N2E5_9FLAO|nr:glycosyltransferase family 4 protein [Putridiphycobacter roseus]PZE18467.1 hypothetical protein DNU06_01135 [Putridiphycobacter roseus]
MEQKKQKILIITYYWPPSGGSGVQRWIKFAKYLPACNWEPIILTVDPSKASYFLVDESLINSVANNVTVIRTKSFEPMRLFAKIIGKKNMPHSGFSNVNKSSKLQTIFRFIRGNLFVTDPRKGWNKYAEKAALQIIDKYNIQHVVTTSPPHSSQLIGIQLKTKRNINWIADLRDPWTDIFYYNQLMKIDFLKRKEAKIEKRVINEADIVLTVSKGLKTIFAAKSEHPDNIHIIENGFDTDDIGTIDPNFNIQFKGKFNLLYVGIISDQYNMHGFFEAFEKITKSYPHIHLNFVGVQDQYIHKIVAALNLQAFVSFFEYVKKASLVNYYAQSDMLVLAIPDTINNEGIVTGKIFEYLSYKKPIIGVGPTKGNAAEILENVSAGKMFDYTDVNGLTEMLRQGVDKTTQFTYEGIVKYTRKNLTQKLVATIETLKNRPL